jgi:pimeloyl-ACP methyl ester carboxylesterase
MSDLPPLDAAVLPAGVRARFVDGVNGLRMHLLEAGFETPGRPLILLLHGFPELAYSWRKVIVPLAEAGFHVVAPDQRGYGRTTGWDPDYDGDVASFHMLNLARDALGLVMALGHESAAAVIGHDFGASVAAWCALVRPDVFRSLVLMAPFAGPPSLPEASRAASSPAPAEDIHAALAALPRPRKHYQWYYSTRAANPDMTQCPQGVHAFLRAYFHHKSADWPGNRPFPLAAWHADELARMPTYYIMDLDRTMPETVAAEMPSPGTIAACRWLPEAELAIYRANMGAPGFRAGCNGTAAAPAACGSPNCNCSPAGRSTCRPCSSAARAIGAPSRPPAPSSICRTAPAPICAAPTASTAPAIGCSRNSPQR